MGSGHRPRNDDLTYMQLCRQLALQESKALRFWAKDGRIPPPSKPIDFITIYLEGRNI